MKRYISPLSIVFFPYSVAFVLYCLFRGLLWEEVFKGHPSLYIQIPIVCWAIAFVLTVASCIISLIKKRDCAELCRTTMFIKLLSVPAFIAIFIFGLACMASMVTSIFSVVLMLLDIMAIALSGLMGITAVKRSYDSHAISLWEMIWYGILQFIFCVDVIASCILYAKVRRAQATQRSLTLCPNNKLMNSRDAHKRTQLTKGYCMGFFDRFKKKREAHTPNIQEAHLSTEEQIQEKVKELLEHIVQIIPANWNELYVRVEMFEGSGSVDFFFKDKDETDYHYSATLEKEFDMPDRAEYNKQDYERFLLGRELWQLFKQNDLPVWSSAVIHWVDGKMDMSFDYTPWQESDFGPMIRIYNFMYHHLGYTPSNEKEEQVYLEIAEMQKKYNG